MNKKIGLTLLSTAVVAAGIWHFAAGKFEESVVTIADNLKASGYVDFEDVKVSKYRFTAYISKPVVKIFWGEKRFDHIHWTLGSSIEIIQNPFVRRIKLKMIGDETVFYRRPDAEPVRIALASRENLKNKTVITFKTKNFFPVLNPGATAADSFENAISQIEKIKFRVLNGAYTVGHFEQPALLFDKIEYKIDPSFVESAEKGKELVLNEVVSIEGFEVNAVGFDTTATTEHEKEQEREIQSLLSTKYSSGFKGTVRINFDEIKKSEKPVLDTLHVQMEGDSKSEQMGVNTTQKHTATIDCAKKSFDGLMNSEFIILDDFKKYYVPIIQYFVELSGGKFDVDEEAFEELIPNFQDYNPWKYDVTVKLSWAGDHMPIQATINYGCKGATAEFSVDAEASKDKVIALMDNKNASPRSVLNNALKVSFKLSPVKTVLDDLESYAGRAAKTLKAEEIKPVIPMVRKITEAVLSQLGLKDDMLSLSVSVPAEGDIILNDKKFSDLMGILLPMVMGAPEAPLAH
jgi:hypothetical protein